MPTYLDYNSTSPVLPQVADLVYKIMTEEYGNAGSRTHLFGVAAKAYVDIARGQVADVVNAKNSEVIFTSGATESNNLAILGLLNYGKNNNKKHIITSSIEHKAVLEPIEHMLSVGFDVTYIEVDETGLVDPQEVAEALREDTLLVSIMHVNNETGCIQPIAELCSALKEHDAYFHVDAAQSYGKLSDGLKNKRIDLISVSGHKVYAPKGVGALVARKRDFGKLPLKPLMFGGGQEKGLRPGTLPVPLIAGLGLACEIASYNSIEWQNHAHALKSQMLELVSEFKGKAIGENTSPFVLNFSIPNIKSEAAMVALKNVAAVSNGSACTSSSYSPSHVLTAMGLDHTTIEGSIRISWSHFTEVLPIEEMKEQLLRVST